ncbi:hypothetical protein HaLaN_13616 [Haematococcus lacustris]|uniref:Uncharacterized protein n=1 Tax=Haematococcus lacustris TaxID=44745 RepID=A0A699ZMM0_HAELA|nr:hypothetical protein HaLaN_13616 [Haematococcus lacustris]
MSLLALRDLTPHLICSLTAASHSGWKFTRANESVTASAFSTVASSAFTCKVHGERLIRLGTNKRCYGARHLKRHNQSILALVSPPCLENEPPKPNSHNDRKAYCCEGLEDHARDSLLHVEHARGHAALRSTGAASRDYTHRNTYTIARLPTLCFLQVGEDSCSMGNECSRAQTSIAFQSPGSYELLLASISAYDLRAFFLAFLILENGERKTSAVTTEPQAGLVVLPGLSFLFVVARLLAREASAVATHEGEDSGQSSDLWAQHSTSEVESRYGPDLPK